MQLRLCSCLYSLDKILSVDISQITNGEITQEILLAVGSQSSITIIFIGGHRDERHSIAVGKSYTRVQNPSHYLKSVTVFTLITGSNSISL